MRHSHPLFIPGPLRRLGQFESRNCTAWRVVYDARQVCHGIICIRVLGERALQGGHGLVSDGCYGL